MKKRWRLFTNIAPVLVLPGLTFISGQAIAMPKYGAYGAEVNSFQAYAVNEDPVLKGVLVIADDKSPVVYVSPSSKKVQTRNFQAVASSACTMLEKDYQLTFLLPNVPVDEYADFAKTNGSYSPFFDYKFGNYVRQATILSQIVNKVAQIQQIKDTHKDVVAAFEKAKGLFEDAQNTFNTAEAAYEELDKNVAKYSQLWFDAETNEERTMRKIDLDEAKQIRAEEKAERKTALRAARAAVLTQQLAYREAKELYDRAIPNLEEIYKDVASLMEFFETIQNLAVKHFTLSERALQAFENTTVGLASASYSIWGDEEVRLENALARYKNRNSFFANVSVARLPIHNIRLHKSVSSVLPANISGNFNGDTSSTMMEKGTTSDSIILSDQSQPSEHAFFTKNKQLVTPEVKTILGDGAGTYQNPVTRGAVCTGKSERRTVTVNTVINLNNVVLSPNFEVPVYRSRRTNVLAQSLALEYDFHTRSDPMKVSCSLDINKFRSFITSSGESGFLFWRKSWTKTEQQQLNNSGISCKVLLSPMAEYPNQEEQRSYLEAIRQGMMQEIAAEFILTYAKNWKIYHRQPSLPNPGKAAYQAGVALMTLCGTNPYCAVASIILKTGDELFGAHYDRISTGDYLSGKIERSYDETSWTTSSGQAIIDLTVTL